jgi:hypothetical protein
MSSDINSPAFPQTVSISGVQKKEIKRFVSLKLYTTDADAIRGMLEAQTNAIHEKYGLKPLSIGK